MNNFLLNDALISPGLHPERPATPILDCLAAVCILVLLPL